MTPNATSSPKEEANGLAEDSFNGAAAAAAKTPLSPAGGEEGEDEDDAEEEEVKRHKDSEVSSQKPCHWKRTLMRGAPLGTFDLLCVCGRHRRRPTTTRLSRSRIPPRPTATPTEKEPLL